MQPSTPSLNLQIAFHLKVQCDYQPLKDSRISTIDSKATFSFLFFSRISQKEGHRNKLLDTSSRIDRLIQPPTTRIKGIRLVRQIRMDPNQQLTTANPRCHRSFRQRLRYRQEPIPKPRSDQLPTYGDVQIPAFSPYLPLYPSIPTSLDPTANQTSSKGSDRYQIQRGVLLELPPLFFHRVTRTHRHRYTRNRAYHPLIPEYLHTHYYQLGFTSRDGSSYYNSNPVAGDFLPNPQIPIHGKAMQRDAEATYHPFLYSRIPPLQSGIKGPL